MRLWIIAALALLVAACGADGEPEQPTARSTVTISDGGVSLATVLGLTRGPLSITLGAGT